MGISRIACTMKMPRPRVAIVGGSFGGRFTAETLVASKIADITIIEKSKYHSHNFVFPKFSVHSKFNNESQAFIPLEKGPLLAGINVIYTTCKRATRSELELEDGQKVPYDYLVIATGVDRQYPSGFGPVTAEQGIGILRETQDKIKNARNIAIVGAGAFGVQLATDIKWIYRDQKDVTLYSSREHILPRFGDNAWKNAEPVMLAMDVQIIQNTRPVIVSDKELTITAQGSTRSLRYDVIFNCTGQGNTLGPFTEIIPSSNIGSTIQTEKTLQLPGLPNVFAIGDVNSAGPHMARAARGQALVAAGNIERLIKAERPLPIDQLVEYEATPIEKALKLSLGFDRNMFCESSGAKVVMREPDYKFDDFAIAYQIFNVPYAEVE